jgi:tetratricopeptide (TPR) repeat protein
MKNSPANASKGKPAAKTSVKSSSKATSKSQASSASRKTIAVAKPAVKTQPSKSVVSKVKSVAPKTSTAAKASSRGTAKPSAKAAVSSSKEPKKSVSVKKNPPATKAAKPAPVAVKSKVTAVVRGTALKSAKLPAPAKPSDAKTSGAKGAKSGQAKPAVKSSKTVARPKVAAKATPAAAKKSAKAALKLVPKSAPKPAAKAAVKAAPPERRPVTPPAKPKRTLVQRTPVKPLPPVKADPVVFRPPTALPKAPKMAEVLKSLDGAMKFFQKSNFAAAADAFEKILAKYPTQSDIVALVSRYIAICKSKLKVPAKVSQTPDSLYDQGVIEMNNGQFEAAIDLFKRALKSQADMPHVLYSLAAAQVRLGDSDEGLKTLEQAVAVREIHRSKARVDPDFLPLRGDSRFQELVGLGAVEVLGRGAVNRSTTWYIETDRQTALNTAGDFGSSPLAVGRGSRRCSRGSRNTSTSRSVRPGMA